MADNSKAVMQMLAELSAGVPQAGPAELADAGAIARKQLAVRLPPDVKAEIAKIAGFVPGDVERVFKNVIAAAKQDPSRVKEVLLQGVTELKQMANLPAREALPGTYPDTATGRAALAKRNAMPHELGPDKVSRLQELLRSTANKVVSGVSAAAAKAAKPLVSAGRAAAAPEGGLSGAAPPKGPPPKLPPRKVPPTKGQIGPAAQLSAAAVLPPHVTQGAKPPPRPTPGASAGAAAAGAGGMVKSGGLLPMILSTLGMSGPATVAGGGAGGAIPPTNVSPPPGAGARGPIPPPGAGNPVIRGVLAEKASVAAVPKAAAAAAEGDWLASLLKSVGLTKGKAAGGVGAILTALLLSKMLDKFYFEPQKEERETKFIEQTRMPADLRAGMANMQGEQSQTQMFNQMLMQQLAMGGGAHPSPLTQGEVRI